MPENVPFYKKVLSFEIVAIENGEALTIDDYLITREGSLLRIYRKFKEVPK